MIPTSKCTCEYCGKSFLGLNRAKFCNMECRGKAIRNSTRTVERSIRGLGKYQTWRNAIIKMYKGRCVDCGKAIIGKREIEMMRWGHINCPKVYIKLRIGFIRD